MVDIVEQDTQVKIADFLNVIHISPSRGSFPRPFYHSEELGEFQRDVYGLRAGVHLSAFVKQKAENVKLRKQFATTMREWETKQDQRRVSENEALKGARLEAVKQRLRDEGYGPQLDTMVSDELKLLGPVRQARQLSDRGEYVRLGLGKRSAHTSSTQGGRQFGMRSWGSWRVSASTFRARWANDKIHIIQVMTQGPMLDST
ncbi:hypothetical protein OH76DRAFT_703304 [Lentinus brumalis]|uniref:Uncharacterized protein n=1 Tax=Lentinus brumalis TaxID=2498619 RepID=A0A371D5Q9_9APHY|nr:hypothetical protein OH76DRAFT_703304 [Polyporus brumalis]